jgi:hypothetical protein
VTITIERVWYGKTVSTPILLTLVPITVGVGIATVNDGEAPRAVLALTSP